MSSPTSGRVLIPGAGGLEEDLLWTGRPKTLSLARRVFKVHFVAAYFLFLLADGALSLRAPGAAGAAARQGEGALFIIALVAVSLLTLWAWLTSRAATYEVTATHVVMRYGIALRARLTIPFGAIETVSVRLNRPSSGDVAIRLKPGARLNYVKLWPHARAGRLFRPEPMLRCLEAPGLAAAILARGVGEAAAVRRELELRREAAPQEGPRDEEVATRRGPGLRKARALAPAPARREEGRRRAASGAA